MPQRVDLYVQSLAELSSVHTPPLQEGTNAWVIATNDYWVLQKNSGAPVGPNVLAPPPEPTAGGYNVRWIRYSSISTPTIELTGDVVAGPGTSPLAPTVDGLQGRPVDNAAPAATNVLTWDGAKWTPAAIPAPTTMGLIQFASFSDSTTQAATVANTTYYIKLNTVEIANGISVTNNTAGNPTRITFSQAGVYEVSYSVQLNKPGGTPAVVSFWVEENRENGGGPVPRSNSDTSVGGSVNTAIPYCAYFLAQNPGDYIEFAWSSDQINTQLLAIPARVGPVRPADPSVIVNVKRISSTP